MARTDTDLRELFAERTNAVPAHSTVARVAAVDRRVRVIRRRRAAGASLGVVVVLLVLTGLSSVFRDGHDQTGPVPAYEQKVGHGMLPRYSDGGEVAAYTTFRTNDKRDATFTFTPTSLGFLVSIDCDRELPKSRMVNVEINGKPFMSGSCGTGVSTDGPSYGDEQARAESLGVHLGEPATVRAYVTEFAPGAKQPDNPPVYRGALADYRVGVAVYSPMPLADFPLPPRPHRLASLDDDVASFGAGRLLGKVDARSVGPNGHGEVVTPLTREGIRVEMYVVAPGAVTVTVNGQTVDVASSWTWAGGGFGPAVLTPTELRHDGVNVKVGDRLTVGFAGTRFTDPAWRAEVRAAKPDATVNGK
jgi:hypothetical protein